LATELCRRIFQERTGFWPSKKNSDAKTLADFCYTIIQGGLWMAKAERNAKPFDHAVDTAFAYLKSLRIK